MAIRRRQYGKAGSVGCPRRTLTRQERALGLKTTTVAAALVLTFAARTAGATDPGAELIDATLPAPSAVLDPGWYFCDASGCVPTAPPWGDWSPGQGGDEPEWDDPDGSDADG